MAGGDGVEERVAPSPVGNLGFGGKGKDDMRNRGDKLHCETMSSAGWSDATYGDQSMEGRCRLGYVVGLMSSSLTSPRHLLQWPSKFTGKRVESGLGGEIYARSEMVDHMLPLRDFFAQFEGFVQIMVGLELNGGLGIK